MPLSNSCSIEAFRSNIGELINSGYDKAQAYAIAKSTLDKACGKSRSAELATQFVSHSIALLAAKATPEFKRMPPPKEALDYFRSKRLAPKFDTSEVWAEEYKHAFTVAKIAQLRVLKDVQQSLTAALTEGQTFRDWADGIEDVLDESGWSRYGTEAQEPQRLRVIYDTNMRTARAEGQWERAQRVKDGLPCFEYNLGPSVNHREDHEDLDGLILSVDDPWWERNSPPSAYGCKCWLRQITRDEADELGVDTAPNYDVFEDGFGYPKGSRAAGLDQALSDAETEVATFSFDPDKHPKGPDGRFTDGSGGAEGRKRL